MDFVFVMNLLKKMFSGNENNYIFGEKDIV